MVTESLEDKKAAFSAEEFQRNLLKGDAIECLKDFIARARDSDDTDVVGEFVHDASTKDGSVIIGLLKSNRPPSELATIFEALQEVFLRVAGDLNSYSPWALTLIRQILQGENLFHVYRGLSLGNTSNEIICTLRFLTSMVMSSSLAAKEVFTNLNWRKEVFSKLLTRVNTKTVKDVRACLIELLISFLISGNLTLKRQFIESSEILSQVFSGLPDDKCSTIETFLRAVTSHVVEEKYIPKTIKIRLLNRQTLSFVMKLFKWKGMKPVEKKFRKKSERLSMAEKEAGGEVVNVSSEDEVRDVHQLAKEFLVAVCCSHKNGIVFKDKQMGTGDRNVNHTITDLLTNSEKPFTNPVMEKTFEEMLTSCPDQICVYFKKLIDTLQPRPSEQFFAAMSFVTRVLDSVDLVNVINTADCSVSGLKLVQMFLNVCCTHVLFSDSLKRMLRHPDLSIKHHCLCYVEVVLKKMKKLLDENEDEAKLLKSKIVRFQDFKDKFSQRVLNLLPSLEDVVSCWELATNVKSAISEEDLSDEALREFSLYNHLQLLVNVMNLYTRFVPVASEHSSDHMSGLLASLGHLHSILQPEDAVDIQIRILKHLEENVKGSCLLLKKIKDKSVIVMLLEIMLATKEAVTQRKTIELIKKLLISTSAFSSNEDEVDIWLKHLDMRVHSIAEIAPFFQDICEIFASNPKLYTNETKSLILEAEGSSGNDEEQAYNSILDEIMEDDNDDVVEQTPFKVSDVGAFSPLVVVAFDLLNSYSQGCGYYLCSVLFDIFHTRPNPDPLFQLIQRNIKLLPRKFNMYKTYFQKKTSTKRYSRTATEPTHVRNFARECFTGESSFPAKIDKSLRRLIKNSDRDQSFLLSREILTYMHFLFKTKRDDCEGLTDFYCKILKIIISKKYDDDSNVIFPLYHQSVAEHLLQRPTIQQSFLSGNHWNLTQLALFTLKHEPNIALSTKKILQKKVEEFLQQEVVSNDLQVDLSAVCEPFLSDFEWCTLSRLMIKLSQFQSSDLLNDDNKWNSIGTLLIKLIDRVSSLHCPTAGSGYVNHAVINADVISSLFRIYIELNQTEAAEELATALLTFFERGPLYWFLVNEEVSAKLLGHMESDVTMEMVRRLCQYSVTHLEAIENWLLASTDFDGRFQDLMLHYMETLNWLPWRPYNSESILTTTAKHFWPRIVSSFQDGTNELAQDFLHSFVKLSSNNQFIDIDDLLQYCNQYSTPTFISVTDSRFLSNSKWIYERLSVNGILINDYHPLAVWIFSWLQFLLKSLTNESDVRVLAEIIEDAEKLPDLGKVLHQEKMWHRLIKTTLKSGLRDKDGSHIIKLLTAILKKLKLNGELWSIHCTSIYSLVIGHSNFIPGILEISNLEWKMNVIDLLTLLVETEKSCCDSAYVPVLLSAYGATLRLLDQKILHLIYLYEENGVDVHSFRPFLWGPTAVGHYSVNKSVTHSLWKQPTMEEVLNLLDKELMMETAFKFPFQLELQPKVTEVETNAKSVYDPRFLQSLLSNLLAPESLVNCNKFIESNGLAFLLASLSSLDVAMRSAGYHNISLFYQHLEGSRYHRRSQWLLMLDCLRNSVTEENMQLPSLISVFFVRCCQLVENPADLMSRPIVNFLLLKPKLDLGVVPEFITLFNSGDIKDHELHRSWMLTFMNLGFRSNADYMLCRKRYVFKLTMAYFDSPLASANGRLLVLELLKQASTVETVAVQLVNRHGLFAFIASAIMHKSEDIISSCIEILYNIWNSKSSDSFIISETLTLLLTALDSISHQQPLVIIEKYLRTLASCLLHVKTASMIFQSKLTIAHMKHLLDIGKDVAARTADQLQDGVQSNLRSSCVDSMCDIIMDWQCDGDVEVFAMLFDFLSKNVTANNVDKSKAMLKWMGNHLKQLPPSAVTSGLFDHLLGRYKSVLFGNMEKVGRRPKQLRALNETFLVIIEKLFSANVNENQQNPLFGHLASDEAQQIFQNFSSKQLMDVKDQYSKDFILGLLACKLWTLSDQVDQLPYYITSRKHSRGHKRSSIEINSSPKKKRKSKQT